MTNTTYSTQRLTYANGVHVGFVVVDKESEVVMMPGDGIHSKTCPFAFDRVNEAIICNLGRNFGGPIKYENALIGTLYRVQDF